VYFGSQLLLPIIFPNQFGNKPQTSGVHLSMSDASVTVGHHPIAVVDNRTDKVLALPSRCPAPPLDVFMVNNPGTAQEAISPVALSGDVQDCLPPHEVQPGASATIDLQPWKYALFASKGTYELRVPVSAVTSGTGAAMTGATVTQPRQDILITRFTIGEPGVFTKIFRTFITAPFLNALIFIAAIVPGHNLGIAIIILTILVKLILFIPTQHAMEGQKKMQLLQPKLEALKKKYPNDPATVQKETMKLWAEYKINPLQSCLPTLIQFPILIGLFYTIRDGSHLDYSQHLIYPFYQHLDWTFGTQFLGLDLLKPNIWVMPLLLVVLQYLQMKLAFTLQDRKKAKTDVIDVGPDGKPVIEPTSALQLQQRIMLYGLPLMIGFFALRFPAAVSVYWGVSTLFGIGQQMIVNREHLRV
jgi:YidC/Oxa1 family membrane protein insertase